jgi:hypothetical protein
MASSSQVAGYYVYRSMTHGGKYLRINSSLVQELTYTDNTVESGVNYHNVIRALDAQATRVSIPTKVLLPFGRTGGVFGAK